MKGERVLNEMNVCSPSAQPRFVDVTVRNPKIPAGRPDLQMRKTLEDLIGMMRSIED
jgi:hypothetical protein